MIARNDQPRECPDPKAYFRRGISLSKEGRHSEAITALRTAVELNREDGAAHFELGIALMANNELNAAVEQIERALDLEDVTANSTPSLEDFAGILCSIGWDIICGGGDPQLALDVLRRSVQLDPDWMWSRVYIGEILATQGRNQEALETLQAAIRRQPLNPLPHAKLGQLLTVAGRCHDACEALKKAIALDPSDGHTYLGYGHALLCCGRNEDAVDAFKKALTIKTRGFLTAYAHEFPAYRGLGDALVEMARFEEAIAAYRRGITLLQKYPAPKNSEELLERYNATLADFRLRTACAYIKNNQSSVAISVCRKVVEDQPNNGEAHFRLGPSLQVVGQVEGAEREFETARRHGYDGCDAP